ncbi:hypothetical protein ACQPYK_41760 [Streptosporangium sp. CA-135522]|uniref:hypothetical protein n=1 Tax=Streptosporangium sp. CA-135522 TaxID=3240072 RepID=UPI003D8CF013
MLNDAEPACQPLIEGYIRSVIEEKPQMARFIGVSSLGYRDQSSDLLGRMGATLTHSAFRPSAIPMIDYLQTSEDDPCYTGVSVLSP